MATPDTPTVTWTAPAAAALIGIVLLAVAPLYLLAGDPAPYYLGVPWWAWVLVAIHYVLLGLVVVLVRQHGVIEAAAGGIE